MLLKQICETLETYAESPSYIRELVKLEAQLADGRTVAERHTFSSSDIARLEEIPETLKELELRSALFPAVYDYRLIPERRLLEVLTEHFASVQTLIQDNLSQVSEEKGAQLLRQTLGALKTMHDLRITHGCISAQSIVVAFDGSFKLGGDLAKLARGGTDFAKDVRDLGTTCLQFFAAQLTPFETWSEAQLQSAVEGKLGGYAAPFADMAKAVLRDMLKGEAATDLYDIVNSWDSQSIRSSIQPEIFGIEPSIPGFFLRSNSSTRILRNIPVSLSSNSSTMTLSSISDASFSSYSSIRTLDSIPEVPLSSHSSARALGSTEQQSPPPRQPPQPSSLHRLELAKHFVSLQIVSLEAVLAFHILDEEVMTRVTNDLMRELNTHGGGIKVKLAIELFQCSRCVSKKNAEERTILPACSHAFCKSCYNCTVIACIQSDDLDNIRCPIDNLQFKPLNSEELRENLEVRVIRKLDELILQREVCICPKCGQNYEITWQKPVAINCQNPECKAKFCSYCKKSPHSFHCGLWDRNERSRIARK